jgi:hypothetical protein
LVVPCYLRPGFNPPTRPIDPGAGSTSGLPEPTFFGAANSAPSVFNQDAATAR